MSALDTCLTRSHGPSGEPVFRLGVPLMDEKCCCAPDFVSASSPTCQLTPSS